MSLRNRKGQRGRVSQHTVSAVTPVTEAEGGIMLSGESAVGVGKPDSEATEGTMLDRLLGMLEKALVCNVQAAQHTYPKQNVKQFQV